MRKFAIIAATLAVLAGTTAAMSLSSASAAPKSTAGHSVRVLHLISHQTSLQVIDIGAKATARVTRSSRPRSTSSTASRLTAAS